MNAFSTSCWIALPRVHLRRLVFLGLTAAMYRVTFGPLILATEPTNSPPPYPCTEPPLRFTLADVLAWQAVTSAPTEWVRRLADSSTVHAACAVLEGLRHPDLGHALAQALSTALPVQKVAVLGVLGRRRESGTVAAIAPLLTNESPAVAAAAARALGDIATMDALNALEAAEPHFVATQRAEYEEAILRAADHAWLDGRTDLVQRAAAWLIRNAQSELGVAGAERYGRRIGLVTTPMAETLSLTRTPSPGAMGILLWLRDDADSNTVAEAIRQWDEWPPMVRAALLVAEHRTGIEPPTGLLRALNDPSDDVAALAIQQAADRNRTDMIAPLATLAAQTNDLERTRLAARALDRTVGSRRYVELHRLATITPELRPVLFPRLGPHADPESISLLIHAIASDESNTRRAAVRALEHYPREKALEPLLTLIETTEDSDTLAVAHETITRLLRREPPSGGAMEALLTRTRRWSAEKRRQALIWIASIPDAAVGAELLTLASGAEPSLAVDAARALGRWANRDLWPQLVATLRRANHPSVRSALLGTALEVLRRAEDDVQEPSERGSAIWELLSIARDSSERRRIVPHLSTMPDPAVPAALLVLLDEPALVPTVVTALTTWIEQFGARWPEPATRAAQRLVILAPDSNVVRRVQIWLDAHRPSSQPQQGTQ
jgi:HEAT repeat protein